MLKCKLCGRRVPEEVERMIRRYEVFYGPVAFVVCEDCMKKLEKAKYN